MRTAPLNGMPKPGITTIPLCSFFRTCANLKIALESKRRSTKSLRSSE
jgi:hypothetical protein